MVATVVEKNLLENLPDRLSDYLEAQHLGIVFDPATYDAMAKDVIAKLGGKYTITPVDLGKKPKPRIDTADQLRRTLAPCDAVIAVGSGTINDLCKYVSFRLGVPYAVIATAPSMNGYVSSTASLIFGRQKSSVQAHQPKALFADVGVLCEAPRKLLRAGLGDVLCRSTVQSDWLLSHRLTGSPYDGSVFDKIIPLEAEMVAQARLLTEKDPTFTKLLMRLLILSGQAMHDVGSSAPASQAEHMVVHMYDMIYGEERGVESFHGEQVAVASVAVSRIQDKLLVKKPKIKPILEKVDRFERLFGKDEGKRLFEIYERKAIDQEKAEALAAKIESNWADIKAEIEELRLPSSKYEMTLKKANCPTTYRDVAWHKDRFEHCLTHAHLTRDRFTFLDLAAMDVTVRFSI